MMNKLTLDEKKTLLLNVAFVVFVSFISGVVGTCVLIAWLDK